MARALTSALLVACVANLAVGLRRKSVALQNQSVASNITAVKCDQLKKLVVNKVKVGPAAEMVCRYWPKRFGNFPAHTVKRATELYNHGFGKGGLYEKLQKTAKARGKHSSFCWRAEMDFVPFDCFKFDNFYKPDMRGEARSSEPTELWCQKRCLKTKGCKHFSYWSWDWGCHIQGSNAFNAGKDYWRNPVAGPPDCSNRSVPHPDDRPVMRCPKGFQSSGLLNVFKSVCSQTCEGTSFPVGCGHGCASNKKSCVTTITNQVSSVMKAVGKVAAFVTGNQALAKVVEKIFSIVEFIITNFWKWLGWAKELWSAYQESESLAAFLTVFMTFVVNHAKEVGQSAKTLEHMFGDVVSFWMDMMKGGFKWHSVNLGYISDTIDKHGEGIMDGVFGIAKAFTYPVCEV